MDDFLFEGLHLLVAEDGSVEQPDGTAFRQLVERRFWVNNHAHVLRGRSDDDTRYIYYALSQRPIRPFISGSVQDKLTQSSLNRIPIAYPPERTRCEISQLLGALDGKIELNRRMAGTLEAMARALFRSWFVDFDPVRARAEGRPTSLPDDVAALFPNRLGDEGSALGWMSQPLGDIAILDRSTRDPCALGEETVDHFSIPAFDSGPAPAREVASTIKSLKLRVGAPVILFSKLNPDTPRVWPVLSASDVPMLASTEFLALQPRPDRMTLAYLACLLSSTAFRDRASGLVTGTSKSHQRVQAGDLMRTVWLVPPPPILRAFDTIAAPLMSRVDDLQRQSRTLAALRDTLLPKLISGELRVRDASAEVSAA